MELSVDLAVSDRAISDFTKAMTEYQRVTGRDAREAVRSAATDLLKSLRKQTIKSKKMMPLRAFDLGRSEPKYITRTAGAKVFRRMVKHFGQKNGKNWVFFEPVDFTYKSRRLKNGGIAESWTEQSRASLIRSARQKYGHIHNAGLAKHSWGWLMWRLFNISTQDDFLNKKVRLTHRHCEGHIDEVAGMLPDGTIDPKAPIHYAITMINRLRYIERALPAGALEAALQKAQKGIEWKIEHGVRSAKFDS